VLQFICNLISEELYKNHTSDLVGGQGRKNDKKISALPFEWNKCLTLGIR
jgi:hypothetical protein